MGNNNSVNLVEGKMPVSNGYIKLTKNSKGYTWEVKKEAMDNQPVETLVGDVWAINEAMKKREKTDEANSAMGNK